MEHDRRKFFSKLVSAAAFAGITGLLVGQRVQRLEAASGVTTNTSNSPGALAFWDDATDITGNPNLFWDNVAGRLSVGTSSPARSVHLVGDNATFRMDRNVNSSAFILVRTDPSFATVWKTFYVGVDASGVNNGSFFVGDVGTSVSGPSTPRIFIDNGGSVGIGTTNPQGRLFVAGDVRQDSAANGLVKAAALVNGGSSPSMIRGFNNIPGGTAPTVTKPFGVGTYAVDFGVNVAQRFFFVTLLSTNSTDPGGAVDGQVLASTRDGNGNAVYIRTNDSTGTSSDRSFYLLIF